MNVLLVEDDQDLLWLCAFLLREAGHTVIEAPSGAIALERCSDAAVDVVIADVELPDMDGRTLLQRLQALTGVSTAIAISGYDSEAEVKKSLAAGFRQHLAKPFSLEQLVRVVQDNSVVQH